jgi:hypothetical protein
MSRLILTAALLSLAFACTPKRVAEASSTIEDMPNEPVADAGTASTSTTTADATPPKEDAPPPAPSLTLARFEAPEGFTAMLPANPEVKRSEVPQGKKKINVLTAQVTAQGAIYSLTRLEYPESVIKKLGAAKMLGDTQAGVAAQAKGSVTETKDVELAGNPGQTFTVAGAQNMVRARSALVGSSLYSLMVVYTGKVPEKADEFLNSLELTAPAAPAPAPKNPAPAPAPAPAPK